MAVEVEELLPADVEVVWALLTDVERMGGLGPENVRTEWLGPKRGLGARFRGHNERPGIGTWSVPCTVVLHEPPRAFGWATGDPETPSTTWTYALVPGDGGTLVRQRFEHGPGFTYLRQAVEARPDREERYVAARAAELADNMRSTLRAAAALLT
jgi:uncharacterized protein YndB with AHSA1/START domain